MNHKPVILLLLAGIFLMSCTDKKESGEQSASPEATESPANDTPSEQTPMKSSIDGTWELNYITGGSKSIDEMFPEGRATLTIDLAEERVNGNAGCNVFTGSCSVEGSSFKVLEPLAVTRKMCREMAGEDLFLKSLAKIDSYTLSDGGKTLDLQAGADAVMKFQRH